MPYTLVTVQVEDYAKWQAGFEALDDLRRDNGEGDYRIFRADDDPNKVVVLIEWESLATPRAGLASPELHEAMRQAGVIGPPEVLFLNEAEPSAV